MTWRPPGGTNMWWVAPLLALTTVTRTTLSVTMESHASCGNLPTGYVGQEGYGRYIPEGRLGLPPPQPPRSTTPQVTAWRPFAVTWPRPWRQCWRHLVWRKVSCRTDMILLVGLYTWIVIPSWKWMLAKNVLIIQCCQTIQKALMQPTNQQTLPWQTASFEAWHTAHII